MAYIPQVDKSSYRLPNCGVYQARGSCAVSGDVESLVKQIGEQVKITTYIQQVDRIFPICVPRVSG